MATFEICSDRRFFGRWKALSAADALARCALAQGYNDVNEFVKACPCSKAVGRQKKAAL